MSFREKSAWICLLSIVLTLGPYFFFVWHLFGKTPVDPSAVWGTFGAAVLVQVVLNAAAHAVFARQAQKDPKDERDVAIESAALRRAYVVLSVAMFSLLAVATFGRNFSILEMGQLLLLGFVAAELTKYSSQVWNYRRGGVA